MFLCRKQNYKYLVENKKQLLWELWLQLALDKKGIQVNIFFPNFFMKICCRYTLEAFQWRVPSEYHNIFFRWNKKNIITFWMQKKKYFVLGYGYKLSFPSIFRVIIRWCVRWIGQMRLACVIFSPVVLTDMFMDGISTCQRRTAKND